MLQAKLKTKLKLKLNENLLCTYDLIEQDELISNAVQQLEQIYDK